MLWNSVKNFFRKTGNFIKGLLGFELSKTDTVTRHEYSPVPEVISIETGTTITSTIENSAPGVPPVFFGNITDDGYSTGIRVKKGNEETEIAIGLSDTHLSKSHNYKNATYTLAAKIDFAEFKTGLEYSYTVTWDNVSTTEYAYVSLDGSVALSILLAKHMGPSKAFKPEYHFARG